MPNFCAVVGCHSRGDRDKNKFFRIPTIPKRGHPEIIACKTVRRSKYIEALRRTDLTETKLKYASICDRHFISGRPAGTTDMFNPYWVPSQEMGYEPKQVTFQYLQQKKPAEKRESTKLTTQPHLIFLKTDTVVGSDLNDESSIITAHLHPKFELTWIQEENEMGKNIEGMKDKKAENMESVTNLIEEQGLSYLDSEQQIVDDCSDDFFYQADSFNNLFPL